MPTTVQIDLLDDLKALIVDGAAEDDRSQQLDLGPSEVGHPCLRHLALKLLHEPEVNRFGDPLPSVVGTGAHSRMEEFANRANTRLGRTRWLPEFRVTVWGNLAGTCDLVDLDTMTAIDWKFPDTSRMSQYSSKGPSEQYRRQAHLYGRGLRNIGIDIQTVAIAFLPRGGQLKAAHLWSEPYSDQVVDETIIRLTTVMALAHDLDLGLHPERYSQIPATPTDCYICPFYARTPLTPTECGGH